MTPTVSNSRPGLVTQLVIYGGLAILAAAGGYFMAISIAGGDEPEPDDRPPIIVSGGGSIHFYDSDTDPAPGGKFVANASGTYSYTNYKKSAPNRFLVSVTGASNAECSADDYRAKTVEIHYLDAQAQDRKMIVTVDKSDAGENALTFDPQAQPVAPNGLRELAVGPDLAKITLVVIQRPGKDDVPCKFDGTKPYATSVKLMQRKK
jgi:hypothetical protein